VSEATGEGGGVSDPQGGVSEGLASDMRAAEQPTGFVGRVKNKGLAIADNRCGSPR
jgi:hypothetical protein